ncbi:sugar phosphate isomerase/epimerase family protein [Enterococcus asini]|uniref:Sugar phosphate isomerase/epimerase n=1 Tax=Enterococcus asini TaxID=57732 RepID=A0AAW8U237_9ENTE|nr:sugar phosphate isomerase/epimerase [Enterococcus asini]MDT2810819.1 sugar phosphate isomerase/epimerase [Enterococcus asini]
MEPKIALQLWSVQAEAKADLCGLLPKVKAWGYEGVEFAGYHGQDPEALRAALLACDLAVAASHIPFSQLRDHLAEVLAYERIIGNRRIVCPYFEFSADNWPTEIAQLQKLKQAVQAQGFEFYYHNHAHELTAVPGVDVLQELARAGVQLEADLYWLEYAGVPAINWLSEQEERVGLLHLKDMAKESRQSTLIGAGKLPLPDYVAFAQQQEIPWLIVEQEAFSEVSPVVAAEQNVKNLQKMFPKKVPY